MKLLDSASIRAGSYSGGMKRRLSVAVALLGNPKVREAVGEKAPRLG